jgi:hypothetical protein
MSFMREDESSADITGKIGIIVLSRRSSGHAKVEPGGLLLRLVLSSSLADELNE